MAITKTKVIDDHGTDTLLAQIFQIVENHYLRRTTYESDQQALQGRVSTLENAGYATQTYVDKKVEDNIITNMEIVDGYLYATYGPVSNSSS